jgi:hypothetical protein
LAGTPLAYTTSAQLGCASGPTPCDNVTAATNAAPLVARYAWGDRFAGRLPSATATETFAIDLAAQQDLTIAASDNDPLCRLAVDVLAPPGVAYFNGQAFATWTDGAAVNDAGGSTTGPGGHVRAPLPGRYTVVVRSTNGSSCPAFRLFLARSDLYGPAMPAW